MTTTDPRPRATSLLVLTTTVAVAASAVAGCAPAPPGGTAAPTAAAPSGHVHGLGIDPDDGLVYAATHHGLVRLDPGGATRVGDGHDLEGFTVVGPSEFLASGHPSAPGPSLGLIRSIDGGHSWTEVSLRGAADLHALTAVGPVVYGWDSLTGVVQRSEDGGGTWRPGARRSVVDLAVDPAEPQHLWATTADGPAESRDGGRTFAREPSIPALLFLETVPDLHGDREPDLVGADTTGRVWGRYRDGWRMTGDLGAAPTALAAVGPDRVLAATATAVVASEDAGRTWRTLAPISP